VNLVNAEILMNVSTGYAIQVKNHICNKPWRILTEYLVPDPISKKLIIPVVSHRPCLIQFGDILCHVEIVTVESCIKRIKGNLFIYFIYLFKKTI